MFTVTSGGTIEYLVVAGGGGGGAANTDADGENPGAGGGGFLMFYSEDPEKLRDKMKKLKVNELKFNFDYEGTKVL